MLTAGCTPGTYNASITATSANGTAGTANVIIALGSPSQLVIAPANASVKSQATQQYTASVKDACNNTLTGQTITWGANSTAGSITAGGLLTASCTRGNYPAGLNASTGALSALELLPGREFPFHEEAIAAFRRRWHPSWHCCRR